MPWPEDVRGPLHARRGDVLADIGFTPVETAGRISAVLAAKEDPAA
ncbi:hypothetical protein ACIQ9E_03295 [Streptomyces sp. NPDC094448]